MGAGLKKQTMVNKRQSSMAFLLMALSLVASADSERQTVIGFGAMECMDYLLKVKEFPELKSQFLAWQSGYLSGLNTGVAAFDEEKADLADRELHDDWLDAYCYEYPKHGVWQAVELLWKSMRLEQGLIDVDEDGD